MTLDPKIDQNMKEAREIIKSSKTKYLIRPKLELYKNLCLDLRDNYGATYMEIKVYLQRFRNATFNLEYLRRTILKWQKEREQ